MIRFYLKIILLFNIILTSCNVDEDISIRDAIFSDMQGEYPMPTTNVLSFNPEVIDFGMVLNNTVHESSIIVSNSFGYPVAVNVSFQNSSSFIQIDQNLITIPANGSKTIIVNYLPTLTSTLNNQLKFRYNFDPQTGNYFQQNVNVIGQSVDIFPTTLIVNPSGNLEFGTVIEGQISTRNITLTNTGTATANWSITNTPLINVTPNSGTIPIGGSQNVTISFTANGFGSGLQAANQNIFYNGGQITIPCRLNRIPATRILSWSVGNPSFGQVPINTTVNKIIIVSNNGNSPLNITNVTFNSQSPAGQFTVTNFSGDIPPGGSINLTLSFRPTAGGSKSCSVQIISNKTSGSETFAFSGFGI